MNSKVVIIGAGASGLMLGALLPKNRAFIIESNSKVGAKIAVSGGGKCNITNHIMEVEQFLGEERFIAPVLKRFNQHALLKWLERGNLEPVLRKKSQYFCKESAKELVSLLLKQNQKQTICLNETLLDVTKKEGLFHIQTTKKSYRAEVLVVASGGLSYPKLGASDIGFKIATSFGHEVKRPAPALVGFTVQKEQFFFKSLAGLSTEVKMRVGEKRCEGSLLFAHKGISGPAVLDASLYWEKGAITVDFLPSFSWERIEGSRKNISSILPMPKRLIKEFLIQLGLFDKPYCTLTLQEKGKLQTLSSYHFAPAGTFGYTKAEVTKGGVETSLIDNNTMMSQKVEGLYFIGEVIDVTGRLGGYNFQWAFSSAYSCARGIENYLKNKEKK